MLPAGRDPPRRRRGAAGGAPAVGGSARCGRPGARPRRRGSAAGASMGDPRPCAVSPGATGRCAGHGPTRAGAPRRGARARPVRGARRARAGDPASGPGTAVREPRSARRVPSARTSAFRPPGWTRRALLRPRGGTRTRIAGARAARSAHRLGIVRRRQIVVRPGRDRGSLRRSRQPGDSLHARRAARADAA